MSVSGYAAWSVVASEQPTTSKWNILGSNDAAFNTYLSATNNVITANMLDTAAITLGYVQVTSNYTTTSSTESQVTGLSVTVTIPAGGRKIRITAIGAANNNGAGGNGVDWTIWDGTVGSGTQLQSGHVDTPGTNYKFPVIAQVIVTPSAGSKTYNVGTNSGDNTHTTQIIASSTQPAFILVEAI